MEEVKDRLLAAASQALHLLLAPIQGCQKMEYNRELEYR